MATADARIEARFVVRHADFSLDVDLNVQGAWPTASPRARP